MIIWITGRPNAGKTTISTELRALFARCQYRTLLLDGDEWRKMTMNFDYSENGRRRNVEMAMRVALAVDEADVMVICAFVSPYRDQRELLKATGNVLEVYLHTTRCHPLKHTYCPTYEQPESGFIDINTDVDVAVCVSDIADAVSDRFKFLEPSSTKGEGI